MTFGVGDNLVATAVRNALRSGCRIGSPCSQLIVV